MFRRLINLILLIVALFSVFLILVSPLFLFTGSFANSLKLSFAKQKISSKSLFVYSWRAIKNQYIDSSMNNQDWNKWKNRYIKKIKNDDDVVVAVNTMLASLNDPYSEFFNPEKFSKQNKLLLESNQFSNFQIPKIQIFKKNKVSIPSPSIKILLTTIAGVVTKAQVVQGSKLCKEIKAGDEIVRIDGYSLFGLDVHAALKLINGKNITQRLEIADDKKLKTVTVISGCLNTRKIDSRILPDNILLISVYSLIGFNSPVEFIKCLNNPDVKGIVVDLRGNVGGSFPNVIFIADMLTGKGLITTIEYRNQTKIKVTAQSQNDYEINKPLVILVDGRTASACEILAGALKFNNRAILVGMPTFGKNSVQNIVPLHNGMGMNITIARYLLGNNVDIGSVGIEPDYKVNITYQDILNKKDRQLQKAIEVINKITAKKIDKD